MAEHDTTSEDVWWKTLCSSLLLLAFAAFSFWYFTDFEAEGGTRRINWIVALVYSIGGKWTVCGILIFLGVAGITLSISEYKNQH